MRQKVIRISANTTAAGRDKLYITPLAHALREGWTVNRVDSLTCVDGSTVLLYILESDKELDEDVETAE